MDQCVHDLVSLGRLATDSDIGTLITRSESSLIFPDRQCAPLCNNGCLLVPDATVPIAPMVKGAQRAVDPEQAHAALNHRPNSLVRRMPECSDAPASWAAVADKPCDHCLMSKHDKMASKSSVPPSKVPGHWSCDIYMISVPHVHGGHKYVFGAHDRYH